MELSNDIVAELPARIERVVELLHARELEGLVVYADAAQLGNVRYLTNYTPIFGPAVLVLRQDGLAALLITFDWDVPRARLASGLERVEAGYAMPGMLEQTLTALDLQSAPVGLVGGTIITHRLYAALVAGGRTQPVELDRDFEQLRLIKSPVEQEMLRRAATATDAAIEVVLGQARAGMSELEIAALVEYEMKKAGADGLAFSASVAAGPNTEKPVSLPSSRRLEPGDLVLMDVGAMWEGYCADVTRTFVVGLPSQRQREVYGVVAGTLAATTALARPGVPAAELHREAVRILGEHGLANYFTHRVGHGIGLETSLEPIDLRRDTFPLEPGMTFCIEPGVYFPGFGGIKIEDDVIVQADGPEVISHARRELITV